MLIFCHIESRITYSPGRVIGTRLFGGFQAHFKWSILSSLLLYDYYLYQVTATIIRGDFDICSESS